MMFHSSRVETGKFRRVYLYIQSRLWYWTKINQPLSTSQERQVNIIRTWIIKMNKSRAPKTSIFISPPVYNIQSSDHYIDALCSNISKLISKNNLPRKQPASSLFRIRSDESTTNNLAIMLWENHGLHSRTVVIEIVWVHFNQSILFAIGKTYPAAIHICRILKKGILPCSDFLIHSLFSFPKLSNNLSDIRYLPKFHRP